MSARHRGTCPWRWFSLTRTRDESDTSMLVLHGFWSAEGLSLWAEDSELSVKSASQALRAARRHPFAASTEVLAAIHAGKPGSAVVLLPSLRSSPLDSPELLRVTPRPAAQSEPVLLPWTVPVTVLPAASALAMLRRTRTRCALRRVGRPTSPISRNSRESWWRAGGFCRHWRGRTRAGRVLAAGRPRCRCDGTECADHGDAAGLPGAVGAPAPYQAGAGGRDVPSSMRMARDAIPTADQLLPPRRGRRPKRLAVEEEWLTALAAPHGRFDADLGRTRRAG